MKTDERRRYFRINETIGIAYELIDGGKAEKSDKPEYAPDLLELVSQQDGKIEQLLIELSHTHPQVSELMGLLNQKLERIANYVSLDGNLVSRIANRVREANISACGIAFNNSDALPENARIRLELTLYPSNETLVVLGLIIACEKLKNEASYYCRVDFYGVSTATQERLIQYIVQSQSAQLKSIRNQNDTP